MRTIGRRWHPRPVIGALVGAVVLVVFLGAAGHDVSPAWASVAERCADTTPAGMVRVAIVVDFGVEPGSPGGQSAECLTVVAGTTGGQLLAQRSAALGRAKPRFEASGLLCAIDGYPAEPECPKAQAGAFRYWSYWSGTTGTWIYGAGNPFVRRLQDGDVEGWRFAASSENQAPSPRTPPNRSSLFPSPPAPAPAVPAVPQPPPGVAPVGPSPRPGAPTASGPIVPSDAVESAQPDAAASANDADPPGEATSSTGRDPGASAATPADELAMAAGGGRPGAPVATIAGVGLVAALGAVALAVARRRNS